MWPWGHLAVGYLLYTALARVRTGRPPSGAAALLVAFGTQFPDLIDKPLAWGFGVLPSGRVGAHSLPIATVVVLVWYASAQYRKRPELGVAFTVGYLTHPFADALLALVQGHTEYVAYLLWPLFDLPFYSTDGIVLASLGPFDLTVYGAVQIGLILVAYGVWVADGTPGLGTLGRAFGGTSEHDRTPDPDQ